MALFTGAGFLNKYLKSARAAAIILLGLLPLPATAAAGDRLQVIPYLVNVRSAPSGEGSVLIKLAEGRSVVEIRRRGNWVQVETGHEDAPAGWIHADLLQEAKRENGTEENQKRREVEALFDLFKQALAEYNTRKKREAGYPYFTDPEYAGDGKITVTGSRYWLRLPMEQRMEHLSEVFEIWAAAVGEGPAITVNVKGRNGEKQMTMFR